LQFETRKLPAEPDAIAPDGSEIRLLSVGMGGGSMVHCRLAPGKTTRAVRHRTVEEMWHCVNGRGQVWRSAGGAQDMTTLRPGVSISIPTGACFQFRSDGNSPLEIIIATTPPWPGEEEAVPCDGIWEPSL
jgi:mannose-6-phosphate isomerase-like protein (cupin superfamily)